MSSRIVPSPVMNLEEKLVSENLNIQSCFHSTVHLSAYWNLTLECVRKHHEAIPFSFQKSSSPNFPIARVFNTNTNCLNCNGICKC